MFSTVYPARTVLRLWDAVFFEGSELLLCAVLAHILSMSETLMRCTSTEQAMAALKLPLRAAHDAEDVVEAAYVVLGQVGLEQIAKLRDEQWSASCETARASRLSQSTRELEQAGLVGAKGHQLTPTDVSRLLDEFKECTAHESPHSAHSGVDEGVGGDAGPFAAAGSGMWGAARVTLLSLHQTVPDFVIMRPEVLDSLLATRLLLILGRSPQGEGNAGEQVLMQQLDWSVYRVLARNQRLIFDVLDAANYQLVTADQYVAAVAATHHHQRSLMDALERLQIALQQCGRADPEETVATGEGSSDMLDAVTSACLRLSTAQRAEAFAKADDTEQRETSEHDFSTGTAHAVTSDSATADLPPAGETASDSTPMDGLGPALEAALVAVLRVWIDVRVKRDVHSSLYGRCSHASAQRLGSALAKLCLKDLISVSDGVGCSEVRAETMDAFGLRISSQFDELHVVEAALRRLPLLYRAVVWVYDLRHAAFAKEASPTGRNEGKHSTTTWVAIGLQGVLIGLLALLYKP